MKYLLPFVLCLTGCFHYTWSESKPVEKEPDPPAIIARGTNGSVDWNCQLTTYNDALAWITCGFQNKTANAQPSACIKVSFYDEATGKLVVASRDVCSGILPAKDTSERYAAFQKENRVTLRRCGELLDLCVMLAGPSQ